MNKVFGLFSLSLLAIAGCTGGQDSGASASVAALTCFHTDEQILCTSTPGGSTGELRQKVEDFYPSACEDGDADADGIPDFLDTDFIGTDSSDDDSDDDGAHDEGDDNAHDGAEDESHHGGDDGAHDEAEDEHDGGDDNSHDEAEHDGGVADADNHHDDSLRCPKCNRGPGTQNDFRLKVDGAKAELDRGKVYVKQGNTLTVPTPDGTLTIQITDATRLDDGNPTPGAEIRAEGTLDDDGTLIAERIKVLCPGPVSVPADEVPPDATPVIVL